MLVVLGVLHIGELLDIGLQLLQKYETKSYQGFRLYLSQFFGFFYQIDIQEDVVLLL